MPTPEEMASALMHYPTTKDAAFAREQGFDYAHRNAEYLNSRRASSYVGIPDLETYVSGRTGRQMPSQDMTTNSSFDTGDAHMRAALAAKRSALATLGMDPGKDVLGYGAPRIMLTQGGRHVGDIGGFYIPASGQTFTGQRDLEDDPSTIVHESLHRGIHKLMNTPYWDPAWNDLGVPLVKGVSSSERFPEGNTGGRNEDVVRWLMQSKMGDPETDRTANAQKSQAEFLFNRPFLESSRRRAQQLEDMEAAAARYLKDKNPRGPR